MSDDESVVSHEHMISLFGTGQLLIQNNNFDSMSKDSCKLDVFVGGELIEFKAQCKICKCGDDSVMCRFCV